VYLELDVKVSAEYLIRKDDIQIINQIEESSSSIGIWLNSTKVILNPLNNENVSIAIASLEFTKLNHPNIAQCFGIYKSSKSYLVTEYFPFGDLQNFISNNKLELKDQLLM
jgi:serine/threonine protein kinase